ncbi:MAG: hypothetical protein AAGA77_22060 [Bacteroidota bacterium]
MDLNKTIQILEALAEGCSPTTGEIITNDSVLNERAVIRALQVAINQLRNNSSAQDSKIQIEENDIKSALDLFKEHNKKFTANSLAGFFLGTRKFKNTHLTSHPLYGKYRPIYKQGQLLDFFSEYILSNNLKVRKPNPYDYIDFFRKEKFNRLSENAVNQLIEKVKELGIVKTENLAEYVVQSRIKYLRAYESWSNKEKELLRKAIQYTNDLDLLSKCFQRGQGAIEHCGQRLIFESKSQNE